jgi:hypothetical protein
MRVSGERIQNRQKIQCSPITSERLGVFCNWRISHRLGWFRMAGSRYTLDIWYFWDLGNIWSGGVVHNRSKSKRVSIHFISRYISLSPITTSISVVVNQSLYPLGTPIDIVPNRKPLNFLKSWVLNTRSGFRHLSQKSSHSQIPPPLYSQRQNPEDLLNTKN